MEHVSERRVEHELELQSSAEESSVAEREDDPYTYIHTYICMYGLELVVYEALSY